MFVYYAGQGMYLTGSDLYSAKRRVQDAEGIYSEQTINIPVSSKRLNDNYDIRILIGNTPKYI